MGSPIPESWNMALGGLVLGSLILSFKAMGIMMFQLSGFYYKGVAMMGIGFWDIAYGHYVGLPRNGILLTKNLQTCIFKARSGALVAFKVVSG